MGAHHRVKNAPSPELADEHARCRSCLTLQGCSFIIRVFTLMLKATQLQVLHCGWSFKTIWYINLLDLTVFSGESEGWEKGQEIFKNITGRTAQLKFYKNLTWVFFFFFICCAHVNSVTPSPQQVRVCPPRMFPEDGANLSSARGILSLIQSSTRRAYQQILDVLEENRRWLAVWDSCQLYWMFSGFVSGLWCLSFVFAPASLSKTQWFKTVCFAFFWFEIVVQNSHFTRFYYLFFSQGEYLANNYAQKV